MSCSSHKKLTDWEYDSLFSGFLRRDLTNRRYSHSGSLSCSSMMKNTCGDLPLPEQREWRLYGIVSAGILANGGCIGDILRCDPIGAFYGVFRMGMDQDLQNPGPLRVGNRSSFGMANLRISRFAFYHTPTLPPPDPGPIKPRITCPENRFPQLL